MRALIVAGAEFNPLKESLTKLQVFNVVSMLPRTGSVPGPADLGVPAAPQEAVEVHWVGHGNATGLLSHEETKFSLNMALLKQKVPAINPGLATHLTNSLVIKNKAGKVTDSNKFTKRASIETRVSQKLGGLVSLGVVKKNVSDSILANLDACIEELGTHRYYAYSNEELAEYLLRAYAPTRICFWACNTGRGAVDALLKAMGSAIGKDDDLRGNLPPTITLLGPTGFLNQMSIKAMLVPYLKGETEAPGLEYETTLEIE